MSKLVLWVGGVVAVLLVAMVIVGAVLINTINAQAEKQAYQDCMARQGFAADEPAPVGVDPDEYISAAVDAAQSCSN